jgi:hypothetical protein
MIERSEQDRDVSNAICTATETLETLHERSESEQNRLINLTAKMLDKLYEALRVCTVVPLARIDTDDEFRALREAMVKLEEEVKRADQRLVAET